MPTTGGKILSLNTKIIDEISLSLYWTGENVDNVDIKYSLNNLDYITDVSNYTLGSGYIISPLTPNTLYYFSITPHDADGNTGNTRTVFTLMPYTSKITSFYSVSQTKNSIFLQWLGKYFKVSISYYRPVSTYNTKTVEYYGLSNTNISNLDSDVSYVFEITPYDRYDYPGDMVSLTAYTEYDPYITDISISNITQQTVDLSWNGLFTQTIVQKSTGEDEKYRSICNIYDTTNSYTVEDGSVRSLTGEITLRYLTPDTTYYFRLRPLDNNDNYGTTSSTVSCSTLPGVYDLSTSEIKNTEITLCWEGNYVSTETVTLYYRASGETEFLTEIISYDDVNDLSFTIEYLITNTIYEIYMEPTGRSDLSTDIIIVTTDFEGSINFDISFITISSIGIELNTNYLGNGPYYNVASVDISHDDINSGEYWTVDTITEQLSKGDVINYTISDLSANEYYSVKVTPISLYGTEYNPCIISNTCTAAEITYFTIGIDGNLEYFILSWKGSLSNSKYEYSTDENFTTSTIVSVNNDNVSLSDDGNLYVYTTPELRATTSYYIRMIPINRDGVDGDKTYYLYNPDIDTIYISEISTTTFQLNWNGIFTNVIIYYSTDGGTTFQKWTSTTTTINDNDTSVVLTKNNSYVYRIQPYYTNVNNTGIDVSGTYSDTVYVPYISSVYIDNIASTENTIDLSWVGGHTIQSYSVAWASSATGTYNIITDSEKISVSNYTVKSSDITNFDLSNSYYFRIIPYVEGTNAPIWTTGISSEYVYNASISSVSIISLTTNTVTLKYSGIYSSVDISYSGNTSGLIHYTSSASPRAATVTDLSSNGSYTFEIIPYNSSSIYGKNQSLTLYTLPYLSNASATAISSSSIMVSWS